MRYRNMTTDDDRVALHEIQTGAAGYANAASRPHPVGGATLSSGADNTRKETQMSSWNVTPIHRTELSAVVAELRKARLRLKDAIADATKALEIVDAEINRVEAET